MYQRASNGLTSFWIFWYSEHADDPDNQQIINDMYDSNFKMCVFHNVKESEKWL